jgi:hypothetical protein
VRALPEGALHGAEVAVITGQNAVGPNPVTGSNTVENQIFAN